MTAQARPILSAWLVLIALCLLGACKAQPKQAPAQPPAGAVGNRDTTQVAVDSWNAAHIDAWLARVPDLTKPEQITAMLGILRAGITATPTAADRAAADRTVDAIAKGNLAAAEKSAAESLSRAKAAEAALAAEREARAQAEAALKDERQRHSEEVRDLKASWSKNLQIWTARGFVALGSLSVVASIGAIFLFGLAVKKHAAGGAVCGLLLIAVGFAVGETWFLWAGRIVLGLFVLSLIGWGIYAWRTGQADRALRAAIQDAKDEAKIGGKQAEEGWAWFKEHLLYRIPRTADGAKSALEKTIDARLVAEGINTQS